MIFHTAAAFQDSGCRGFRVLAFGEPRNDKVTSAI